MQGAPLLATFLDPVALAIVGGGTLVATALRGPIGDSFRAIGALRLIFRRPLGAEELRADVASIDRIVRRQGMSALAGVTPRDPDVAEVVAAIANRAKPDRVEELLAEARARRAERHAVIQNFWDAAAEAAPAMGMIATLVGLVRMFSAMDDPDAIGGAMAIALLSTLYGALLANLVAAPIAARLRRLSQAEETARATLVTPLRTLAALRSPSVAAMRPQAV